MRIAIDWDTPNLTWKEKPKMAKLTLRKNVITVQRVRT